MVSGLQAECEEIRQGCVFRGKCHERCSGFLEPGPSNPKSFMGVSEN